MKKINLVLFLFSLLCMYGVIVLLTRLLTWRFLENPLVTFGIIGIPSFVTCVISFLALFYDFTEIQKKFKEIISIRINNNRFVGVLCVIAVCMLAASMLITYAATPLWWRIFIDDHFLNSEQDNFTSTLEILNDDIKKYSESSYNILNRALLIFRERFAYNHQAQRDIKYNEINSIITYLSRVEYENDFIRSFGLFAIAEGRSLTRVYDGAKKDYRRFLDMPSRTLTKKWRESAVLNFGNIYYYTGDYVGAINEWKSIIPRVSVYGNIADAYIQMKNYTEANRFTAMGLQAIKGNEAEFKNIYYGLIQGEIISYLALYKVQKAVDAYEAAVKIVEADDYLIATHCLSLMIKDPIQFETFIVGAMTDKRIDEKNYYFLRGLCQCCRSDCPGAFMWFNKFLGGQQQVEHKVLSDLILKEMNDRGLNNIAYIRKRVQGCLGR